MAESTRSRRIEPIARIADHKEQLGVKEFASRQEALAAQELRLAELRAWWRDYADGMKNKRSPGGPGMLRDGRLFLAQLSGAIQRQQEVVEQARMELEAARARWLALRMDHEALEKVVARCRDEEEREARRSEQREQDECAARATAARPL
ncbi:MAG TPA: flagellar export protein FliJ [Gammaproteobacteria bacterium]|nr:flagellar export protein FliJ [Gammaproteobacteria bacterium]